MTSVDARGNLHDTKDGRFKPKHFPKGRIEHPVPSMSEPINIRASICKSSAQLVSERDLGNGRIKGDYELSDGRRVFIITSERDRLPSKLDKTSYIGFYEYRLMFLDEQESEEGESDLLVGMARIYYRPYGGRDKQMLGVQTRSRINTGTRLSPIDFGSLDSVFDDLTGEYINYGDCNYTYLIEGLL